MAIIMVFQAVNFDKDKDKCHKKACHRATRHASSTQYANLMHWNVSLRGNRKRFQSKIKFTLSDLKKTLQHVVKQVIVINKEV